MASANGSIFKSSRIRIRTINRRLRLLHLHCNRLAGDVKEPAHLSKKVGRGVPGVVVWSLLIVCVNWPQVHISFVLPYT